MIVVSSTFVADIMQADLSELLKQFTQENTKFEYSPIFSQFWLFNSTLRQNTSGLNVLLIRLSDLLPTASATTPCEVEQFITDWSYTLALRATPMSVPLLILVTPETHLPPTEAAFFANIALQMQQNIKKTDKNVVMYLASELSESITEDTIVSPYIDTLPHIPYSLEFYRTLNMYIARHYASFSEQPYLTPIEPLPYYVSPIEEMIKRHVLGLCARHGLIIADQDMSLIALGLNSLQALHICTELLPYYPCTLTPADLLSESMSFYALLENILQEKTPCLPPPGREQSNRLPLSTNQSRLWYDEKNTEQSSKHHLFVAYAIPKDCDSALLERAFLTLIERHDVLRFAFYAAEKKPFIQLALFDNLSFEIQQHRVADELSLLNFMDRFQQKAFDLSQAPLLRASIVQTPNRSILLICLHQIIHDAWSLHTLCQELSLLYLAYENFIEPRLPSITTTYQDFILWQKHSINAETCAVQTQFWQNFLHKLPVTEFIYDKSHTKENHPIHNQRLKFQLNQDTTLSLRHMAAQHDITLYELLMSAFGLFVSHYSGQDDVCLLTAVSNRKAAHYHCIGYFISLLLVRMHIPEDIYWTQLLKNNKDNLKTILAHQDLSLTAMLDATGEHSHQSLFHQIAFIFNNHPKPSLVLGDQECERIATYEDPPMLYDACKEVRYSHFICYMQENDHDLTGVFEYNSALLSSELLNHMQHAFCHLLTHIAYHPPAYAKAIPLLNEQQKTQLLHQGDPRCVLGPHLNPMPVGAPGTLFVHENALSRQTKLNPIAIGKETFCDTGDRVTWQVDGRLKYLSHENEQLEINGYRVDPYKIEALLKTQPFIEEAIVMASQDDPIELIAFVLVKDHHHLSEFNLQHYLKPHLAKYMLPKKYYQMEHQPLSYNGKIDKQLLASSRLQPIIYPEYEYAQTPLQDKVMTFFAEALRIDKSLIGIHAHFFDLGGTSISGLDLIQRLNEHFYLKINFSMLYEYDSVKLLSEQIAELLYKINPTQRQQTADSVLKRIKSGDPDHIALVFIHPVGGTGFCYLDLIKLLPPEQPCYIIQDPSIDAQQLLFDDIVSMATYYNHALLKQLQGKPCILAGYSFGGMLALEMVGQLEHKNLGHCIHSVISFDTWIISHMHNEQDKAEYTQKMNAEFEKITEQLRETQLSSSESWMRQYYGQLQQLGMTYVPPRISKKIILFKAMRSLDSQNNHLDASNYLNSYTLQPPDVHLLDCNHHTMLHWPFIEDIARIMRRYFKTEAYQPVA